jgi:hypothetical protein
MTALGQARGDFDSRRSQRIALTLQALRRERCDVLPRPARSAVAGKRRPSTFEDLQVDYGPLGRFTKCGFKHCVPPSSLVTKLLSSDLTELGASDGSVEPL